MRGVIKRTQSDSARFRSSGIYGNKKMFPEPQLHSGEQKMGDLSILGELLLVERLWIEEMLKSMQRLDAIPPVF